MRAFTYEPRWLLLFALLCTAVPKAFSAWPDVPFAEVRAYAWPATKPTGIPIFPTVVSKDGSLEPGVLNPDGARLSRSQVKRLLDAQARRLRRPSPRSSCYYPHNAFVFRDAQGKTVAFIEICFDCRAVRVEPRDKGSHPKLGVFAEIFSELKLPFGDTTLDRLRHYERDFRAWERKALERKRRLPVGNRELIEDVLF